jgi:ribose transport system permease protein
MDTYVEKSETLKSLFSKKQKLDTFRNFALVLVLIVLCIVMSFLSDNFFTSSNFLNIARQISVTAISAVGMTLVIIIGGIDLSIGSVIAFSGVIAASTLSTTQSPVLAVLAALAAGAVVGFVNGFVTAKAQITGFITTLATMGIVRGISFIYTGGYPITIMDKNFSFLGIGYLFMVPVPILIMLLILALGYFLTNHTRFGRYVYALGGNEQTTRWSGINVDRIKIYVYTLSGLLTALAGIVLAGRLSSGQPNAGQSFEFDVITAVIVGGTSLMGGKGNVLGTLIGVVLIGVLSNGLTLLNVSSYYQMVVKGIIILIAVLVDRLSRK